MHFNPRPPRGGRQGSRRSRPLPFCYFNPRPPRGGRHKPVKNRRSLFSISIHVLREEDDDSAPHPGAVGGISIHVLREEDDAGVRRCARHQRISIHVLREEDDAVNLIPCDMRMLFQSTSSARRTTRNHPAAESGRHISIHVLREEDDVHR